MGLMTDLFNILFGGRNVVAETAQVFRVNAEAADLRAHDMQVAALTQLSAEFAAPKLGLFDRLIDGLNRLPRPALALGSIALLVMAMVDPVWFAARMEGMALVPEPLWWLIGAVVSFYFGARHQLKSQEFQERIATTVSRAAEVTQRVAQIEELRAQEEVQSGDNPALTAWRAKAGR